MGIHSSCPLLPLSAPSEASRRFPYLPKPGEGTYYPEGMPGRWSRVDLSVAAIVQETCVCGVSTRKAGRVAERLGISSLSSSEVSRRCDSLDGEVEGMRSRDLSGTPCCYVWLDATNNVQERANREVKRRYRVVQTFPSVRSMVRPACASILEEEGRWATQRTFSEESAALGFAEPAPRPPLTEGRRRALERRTGEIVDEIVERRGLKKA